MKGQGGGGTSRGGGRVTTGGGSDTVIHTRERKTKEINDNIVILREALFTNDGRDKNILAGLAPVFLSYNR
jgi:hypothetical protein